MAFPYSTGAGQGSGLGLWVSSPDQKLINFDNVTRWEVVGRVLRAKHIGGDATDATYSSEADAAAAYQGVLDLVGTSGLTLNLQYATPNTGASGAPVYVVLVGGGFQFDIVTGSFLGTVAVGGTSATITYVNSRTLLLTWTPGSAGAKDIVYTARDGTTTVTLTAGFTAS